MGVCEDRTVGLPTVDARKEADIWAEMHESEITFLGETSDDVEETIRRKVTLKNAVTVISQKSVMLQMR